ncbi:outer membrane beta-barrel protein [Salmonella enterica]|uniref:outer membrane beta-barrel protein n=1 Tax=Salmonella enterica TaxID=28901 RepID=UPI0015FF50AF
MRYLLHAPANSGAGLDLLTNFIDDTKARLRFFCVVRLATSQWWAGGGAAKRAGVDEAGKVNPVRFHHPRD